MSSNDKLSPHALRKALGCFATGVTVVTTRSSEGANVGLTVNSFNSVSLEPPLVLWSLGQRSRFTEVFKESEYFGVNILSHEQLELSRRFASPVEDRFADVDWFSGPRDIPLLNNCLAHLICSIERRIDGGDHTIILGRIEDYELAALQPLVFFQGRFETSAPLTNTA